MFQRYLSIGAVPELRPDPVQSEKIGMELELMLPIDIYWKAQDLIQEIRYARINGSSTYRLWYRFCKLIYPCIVTEKERMWFRRNVQNKL